MITFRHADNRHPFLWESQAQPAARWHGDGDGPVAYLAESPDGAWAEFLRHEEIADVDDIAGITRSLWAIELEETALEAPDLPEAILTGGPDAYDACRGEARRLRAGGAAGLIAPSAALVPDTPSGWRTDGGLRPGDPRRERVVVLFGRRPDLLGWSACAEGRPRADLLGRVRPLLSVAVPEPTGQQQSSPAGASDGDIRAQLRQLAQLFEAGILSDAEFAAAKAKLLEER